MIKLKLKILKGEFTIHKFSSNEHTPEDVSKSEFYWIGKTDEELSIVCDSNIFLNSLEKNDSWSIIRLDSILDFTLVGILADISTILKESEISIFALSTFNTDYIMVKKDKLDKARNALIENGYEFKKEN